MARSDRLDPLTYELRRLGFRWKESVLIIATIAGAVAFHIILASSAAGLRAEVNEELEEYRVSHAPKNPRRRG